MPRKERVTEVVEAACDDLCFADFSDEPGVRRRPLFARGQLLIKYVIKNKTDLVGGGRKKLLTVSGIGVGAHRHPLSPVTAVPDDLLAHVAPLGWEHIGLTGDYVWTEVNPAAPFRPLREIRSMFQPLAA